MDSKGSYTLTIPKQNAGTILTLKQAKTGFETLSKKVTVANGQFSTFTFNTPTSSTTTISGKGEPGAAVGVYLSNGKRLAITTVNNKGTYSLTIPKQQAGTPLSIRMAKTGYDKLVKDVTVLNEFKVFTIKTTPTTSTTAIYGTGEPGAVVRAFVNGKAISSLTTVNAKGNYKLVIPKQAAGTTIQIKMANSGYKTVSQTVDVLKTFKTFTFNTPTTSTTTISGKGEPGAAVGVYLSNGKRLAITTVNSKGTYSLTIPKQKKGTALSIRMAKTGYEKLVKDVTVC